MCKISPTKNGMAISKGRLQLNLAATWLGSDLLVTLSGGAAHIGACALACPPDKTETLCCKGHRERELAAETANIFARALDCKVAVICGIHYNEITRQEIEDILSMSSTLAKKMASALSAAAAGEKSGSGS